MSKPPKDPKLYHITHVENLPSILREGSLWSDAGLVARGGPTATIGMGSIKRRRLALPVKCHPGDCVGDYVPFYFCPRSIMLYLIHCANHPELAYRGGQAPILHLELDLHEAIAWATGQGRRWAISLSNAGAGYSEFRNRVEQLGEVDWESVAATDFRSPKVKEGKQSEFLVHESVPWHLVQRIGACTAETQRQAQRALGGAEHQPPVEVIRTWYF
jgi:hypothetical protein